MAKKKVKLLNIRVMFSEKEDLLNIFEKMIFNIKRGKQKKSDSWNSKDDKSYSYYSFTQEYAPRYDYKESHINGNVCHVFKSDL